LKQGADVLMVRHPVERYDEVDKEDNAEDEDGKENEIAASREKYNSL